MDKLPESICILRLSALGDVTHLLPVVHTLRARYPQLKITWIIGKFEYKLMRALPDVEFIPYDKKGGFKAWLALRKQLAGRRFDALLLMQLSARANLVSSAVRAERRIGFDAARSKEGHGLFINERITPAPGGHVLDGLMQFAAAMGADAFQYDWSLPSAPADHAWVDQVLPDQQPFAVISPCSSHRLRNWNPAGYAGLADHLAQRYGLRIVLCGGPTDLERETAAAISQHMQMPALNLVGQDTLPQFLALLRRARLLISPDSGPAHMASVAGIPVLGLYAATDPQRSGPYQYRDYCVDAYSQAAQQLEGQPASALKWGHKIEKRGVMDLITLEQAIAQAERLMMATESAFVPPAQ